jgi:hypothetical protein
MCICKKDKPSTSDAHDDGEFEHGMQRKGVSTCKKQHKKQKQLTEVARSKAPCSSSKANQNNMKMIQSAERETREW